MLRTERRRRSIVVVRIINLVRVKFDLVVVELEVRRVIEADIGIRIICLCPSESPELENVPRWQQGVISFLHII